MTSVPYHPNELGYERLQKTEPMIGTGLWGVLILAVDLWLSLVVVIISAPFVLCGLAEVIMDMPTSWRVRWIRREKAQ